MARGNAGIGLHQRDFGDGKRGNNDFNVIDGQTGIIDGLSGVNELGILGSLSGNENWVCDDGHNNITIN